MQTRLKSLFWASLGASLLALQAPAAAQATWPEKPVTLVVPYSPGGPTDVVARMLAIPMGKSLGQPFVVDNRPGAGGNIGTLAGARAAPDGYTLVMSAIGPLAANRTLYRELGYDPEKDFEPISLFAVFPNVVVVSAKLPGRLSNWWLMRSSARTSSIMVRSALAARSTSRPYISSRSQG
jgi:tripartite-type tricarboxylate transporter receptor subunit TctC